MVGEEEVMTADGLLLLMDHAAMRDTGHDARHGARCVVGTGGAQDQDIGFGEILQIPLRSGSGFVEGESGRKKSFFSTSRTRMALNTCFLLISVCFFLVHDILQEGHFAFRLGQHDDFCFGFYMSLFRVFVAAFLSLGPHASGT